MITSGLLRFHIVVSSVMRELLLKGRWMESGMSPGNNGPRFYCIVKTRGMKVFT